MRFLGIYIISTFLLAKNFMTLQNQVFITIYPKKKDLKDDI